MKNIGILILDMRTTRAKIICPQCHAECDAHTDALGQGKVPSDGAFGICAVCGAITVYINNATEQRLATEQEVEELPDDFRSYITGLRDTIERIAKHKKKT